MGGAFPKSTGKHGEFNFVNVNEDGRDARYVADYWPTPILFTGFEVGEAIQTGTILATTPFANPARRAYELYPSNDGMALTRERPSWDQTAILAAVRAPELYWRVESGGRCVVHPDGHKRMENGPRCTPRLLGRANAGGGTRATDLGNDGGGPKRGDVKLCVARFSVLGFEFWRI